MENISIPKAPPSHHHYQPDLKDLEQVPPNGVLFFPPLPPKPPSCNIIPFHQWECRGVRVPSPPIPQEPTKRSTLDNELKDWHKQLSVLGADHSDGSLLYLNIDRSPEAVAARRKAKRLRYVERHGLARRVAQKDCWKIGEVNVDWVEPPNTSQSNYDISIPPFTRLMDATRDFLYSRNEEFQFKRSKCLFDQIRHTLGIRRDFAGDHWNGSGPNAVEYVPSSAIRRGQISRLGSSHLVENQSEIVDEICPLLRCTEKCVRGFIALARKESEAIWDVEPAVKMLKIFAALMCFIQYYEVFPDPKLQGPFERAVRLAMEGPQRVIDAQMLDNVIDHHAAFHRAAWTLFCGSYGDKRRGFTEIAKQIGLIEDIRPTTSTEEEVDYGGWNLPTELATQIKKTELSAEEATSYLRPLFHPVSVELVTLLNYIPYSRRRIVAVFPPTNKGDKGNPMFMSSFIRLRTTPAPWTSEESWRQPQTATSKARDDVDAGDPSVATFEKESNTIEEPAEMDIWVEGNLSSLPEYKALIGMALRGRWVEIGIADTASWWIFKSKDYTLPSIWQSYSEEEQR